MVRGDLVIGVALALAVTAAAAYGSWVITSAALVERVRRASDVIDRPPTPDELERLWVIARSERARLTAPPRVPRQYHPVSQPLDIDALIAALEPCGSGAMPTCRLHREATCRPDTPCCPTCPTTATS
jgi:hypothetical protein